MISDSERREVARTLRLMCESEIPTSDMYTLLDETDRDHQACAITLCGAVGFAVSDEPSIREVILHLADVIASSIGVDIAGKFYHEAEKEVYAALADFIDRPTCHISETDHEFEDSVRCDRCQVTFSRPWEPFKFCPSCGAEVIE